MKSTWEVNEDFFEKLTYIILPRSWMEENTWIICCKVDITNSISQLIVWTNKKLETKSNQSYWNEAPHWSCILDSVCHYLINVSICSPRSTYPDIFSLWFIEEKTFRDILVLKLDIYILRQKRLQIKTAVNPAFNRKIKSAQSW